MINRSRFSLYAQNEESFCALHIELVHRCTVIDMLGLVTLNFNKLSAWQAQPGRFLPADFKRLKDSGITIFHPAVGYTTGDVHASSLRDISGWNALIAARGDDFLRVDCAASLERDKSQGKIGILVGQQNSDHFRTVEDVDRFYKLGQRVSQLTYIHNRIGGGSSDGNDTGLSPYGVQVVERMNALGMAVDISHCGDRTSLDAIEASRKPVLVTHSNCRALVPYSARCKSDEAIFKAAVKGGVIGVTMVRAFVRTGGPTTIEDVLDHIDHIVKVAGVEYVGVLSHLHLHCPHLPLPPK